MYILWLCIFLFLFVTVNNLIVIPTRPEIKYLNAKYIKSATVNIRRHSRDSPYYVNVFAELNHSWGNNVTIGFEPYEYIGGNYVPVLFRMEYELCKFYKEPIVGKMVVDQLPKNMSNCPIPAGYYALPNITVHFDNFPVKIPFTYEAIEVRGCSDIKGSITATKEPIFNLTVYGKAIQKPRNKQKH